MWRCNWCGAEFEEPDSVDEGNHFMFNRLVSLVCPECGDDDIEEIEDEDRSDL